MDSITTLGAGLAVLGSKEILTKLLGPTADYIGEETRNLVAKCNINLDNIFQKAVKKLGKHFDEHGTVNPRILKNIYDEGRFCEDELTAEYYAGILASSRSNNGRDDRGVSLLALVKDLSFYQLRFHYLAYSIIYNLFKGQECNIGTPDSKKLGVFIPYNVFETAMEFTETEKPPIILAHILFGLGKHDLISDFISGPPEHLRQLVPATDGGIILSPTVPGAELFLWCLGYPGSAGVELLEIDTISAIECIKIEDGAKSTEDMRRALPPTK
ncbi:hypothetical protein METP3_01585 [Methanosarcinales archaeon]|nr:hypothetical protein METP3_01585 [Methanosarcinales archaeon]